MGCVWWNANPLGLRRCISPSMSWHACLSTRVSDAAPVSSSSSELDVDHSTSTASVVPSASSTARSNSKSSSSSSPPPRFLGFVHPLGSSSSAADFFLLPKKPAAFFAAFFSRALRSFSRFLRRAFCSGVSSGSGSQKESSFTAAPSRREMTAAAMALATKAPEEAYCASTSATIPCASDAQISLTSESAICLQMASVRNDSWRRHSRLLSVSDHSVGCVATLLTTMSQISTASSRHVFATVPPTLFVGVFGRSVVKSVSPVKDSADWRYLSRAATGMCASFIFSKRSFALAGTYVSRRLSPPPPSSLTNRFTSSSRLRCFISAGCSGNTNGDTGR
mmetsp:Transcript_8/g.44  ORF Transcript_8/g.44 Transcript_8/m.44 type:complete len:336 (-) Transcript_8:1076-2083(-)